MQTVEVLSQLISECHEWFEATVSDVTAEQAHWHPPGVANPICAVYAHVVAGADVTVNTILNARPPLMRNHGGGKAGLSKPPGPGDWHEWAANLQIDLDIYRPYARAVYSCWAEYLKSLSDNDLERVVDLSMFGMAGRSLAQVLGMQVEHFSGHCGEIAALKGLQGAVGYRPGTSDGIG